MVPGRALQVFVGNPAVQIDNNASERALRIVTLGRNNFFFVGNDVAGQSLPRRRWAGIDELRDLCILFTRPRARFGAGKMCSPGPYDKHE